MIILVIVLIFIIIILSTSIIDYKNNIKYITKQIEESKGELRNIKIHSLNKEIDKLAVRINELYEKNHDINLKIRKSDDELRKSIQNISHDLRTPLTSIMGYIELLKSKSITLENEQKYLEIIERRSVNLYSLITSFYELSTIESYEHKFELKSVKINDLLCENIAAFYNDFLNKNLEPSISIDENVPTIITDSDAVTRIFSNLISNILKYGSNNVSISLKKQENSLITEFTNDAPNLKEEDVLHIFDRFYTADLARSSNNTGLGLSIVKLLVEQLGHKIEASLAEGVLSIKIEWNILISNEDLYS